MSNYKIKDNKHNYQQNYKPSCRNKLELIHK